MNYDTQFSFLSEESSVIAFLPTEVPRGPAPEGGWRLRPQHTDNLRARERELPAKWAARLLLLELVLALGATTATRTRLESSEAEKG